MAEIFKRLFQPHNSINEQQMGSPANKPYTNHEVKPNKIDEMLPRLIVGRAYSVGKQRSQNEDAIFTLSCTVDSSKNHLQVGLFIVADGMGGHQHGDLASKIAVHVFSDHILQNLAQLLFNSKRGEIATSIQELMRESTLEAHAQIAKKVPGGGSTLTAALVVGEQLTISHIGDSRAYMIDHDGSMKVLTRDHSLVNRMIELGQISPEEGADHPQRNVLYRALGPVEKINPDISTHLVPAFSRLLLCSDGLWGVLTEEAILETIQTSSDPQPACQELVAAANQAGGPDNISVIIVNF